MGERLLVFFPLPGMTKVGRGAVYVFTLAPTGILTGRVTPRAPAKNVPIGGAYGYDNG
jgi:hypothetical protein